MKRIVVILCVVSLLITFLIIPAAATENDSVSAYQPRFIDLLSVSTDFTVQTYLNDELRSETIVKDPTVRLNNPGLTVKFIWGDSSTNLYHDYIYLAVQASKVPSSVNLGSRAGTLIGVAGGVYYYKFSVTGTFKASYSISIYMGESYTGQIAISSAFAVIDNSTPINEVNFRAIGQFKSDGQYYTQSLINEAVTLPYYYTKTFSSIASAPEQMFVDINFPVPVPYADSVSVTFLSTNVWPNYYDQDTLSQGGVFVNNDNDSIESIPYILSDAVTSGNQNGHPIYLYTVTVDLTGYEFTDNAFLTFRTYLGFLSTNADQSNQHNFYFLAINSCSVNLNISEKPWYMRLFYWFQGEFSSLRNHLVGLFNNIDSTLKEGFGVGESVPDISDQQQQIQDDVGGMDQIGGEMEDSRQEMEELLPEMPSWEDTGLDGFDTIVGSYIQQIKEFFTAIYENVILSQILTYTFLFALGGFILFGERM